MGIPRSLNPCLTWHFFAVPCDVYVAGDIYQTQIFDGDCKRVFKKVTEKWKKFVDISSKVATLLLTNSYTEVTGPKNDRTSQIDLNIAR